MASADANDVKIVKVKVQKLTREGVKPYGDILDEDHPIFPQVDPGQGAVAFEINTMVRNDSHRQALAQMAIHGSYTQSFIILKGSMIMVLAPAPADLKAAHEDLVFDYDRIGAFVMNEGDILHIDRGVWHGAVILGHSCRFVNVTRKDEGEGTTDVGESDDDDEELSRHYIEHVNIVRRDKRQIALEL